MQLKVEKTHLTITIYSGIELTKCRDALELSQQQFANRAGWSQSRQQRLESNDWNRLDTETAEGFERAGLAIDDLADVASETIILDLLARRSALATG